MDSRRRIVRLFGTLDPGGHLDGAPEGGEVLLQIRPGLRTVWRGDDSVQIGLDPGCGAVLEGLTPPDRALVHRLSTGIDQGAVRSGPGADGERARTLLRLLAGRGVLVDRRAGRAVLAGLARDASRLAPDAAVWGLVHPDGGDGWELMAARARRTVEIRGAGRTGTAVSTVLAAAGIGRVDLLDTGVVAPADVAPAGAAWADVGRATEGAAQRARERLRPGGPVDDLTAAPALPDLVVLVRASVADSAEAAGLLDAGIAHLAVVVRERTLLVGPLVVPGAAPCLRCLDLHRTDRDPAWPRVLAQLAGSDERPPEETASALLAASLAALQVLGHLDGRGRPAALGATLEVELPDGLVSRRPWPPHPSCGCLRAAPAGHRERSGPAEGRMTS